MRPLLASLLLLVAGCAAPAATDPTPAPRGHGPDGASLPPTGEWADAEAAPIRPGVQVVSDTGQCTSNFVFTTATDVYLGLAAHCVDGLALGAPLDVAGGAAVGALAYSSWLAMDAVEEADENVRALNDFALVLLPPDARAKVHPAMRHFGGPTGLADSAAIRPGEKVLTYGNSGLRAQIEPASWHEGYVFDREDWSSTVYTATPGVPGDSGSGVLTGDGRALGVLVTLTILPTAGSNGVTHLDRALAYAKDHAGIEVELATAPLEDGGVLPR